jgi:N-glycosidase YbiA
MSEFACYLLLSQDKKRTYIGATVDVNRRLQQHNREKAGGARATAGRTWTRVAYVTGFPSWKEALRFEWAWKHSGTHGFVGRMRGLAELLTKERPTSNSVPFSEWNTHFLLWVHKDWISTLEKIEGCLGLVRTVAPSVQFIPSYLSYTFPCFSFQMSSASSASSASSDSNMSVAQFQQLVSMLDALKVDVASCSARLEALSTAAATAIPAAPAFAAVAAPDLPKKGRKPKADGRKPREKKVCPPAAEGVIRFGGSKGKYGEFSNLFKHEITVDGETFPTVQHYLAYKRFETTDADYAALVRGEKNAAMLVGRMRTKEHPARADWDDVRDDLLMAALEAKFEDAKLRSLLLETGTAPIEFESTVDAVMGIGADGAGANELGKALAALREALTDA